jgi:hypothetical protein
MHIQASKRSVGASFRCAAIAGFIAVLMNAPLIALAQTSQPTLQSPDLDAKKEPSPRLPSTGESLSERLDRSGGVIRPPDSMDTGITVSPKESGAGSNMPVIPPPGSPGGDQSVQPK